MHTTSKRPLETLGTNGLYPALEPLQAGILQLDDIHTMYFEQSGNLDGVPVVFLHGGPGSGASAIHRQFFDPAFYRIVIFDQRGAGRSSPLGELRDNSTPHLINDIETLRKHLGIDRWIVFGGSWGSTLALAYAEHHPQRTMALILRGIFLCRQAEIDWFLAGIRSVFPEAWRKFVPESAQAHWYSSCFPAPNHSDGRNDPRAAARYSTSPDQKNSD